MDSSKKFLCENDCHISGTGLSFRFPVPCNYHSTDHNHKSCIVTDCNYATYGVSLSSRRPQISGPLPRHFGLANHPTHTLLPKHRLPLKFSLFQVITFRFYVKRFFILIMPLQVDKKPLPGPCRPCSCVRLRPPFFASLTSSIQYTVWVESNRLD